MDALTSKTTLAKRLKVTRNTLRKFHSEYALEYIGDYDNSFARVGDEIANIPLNDYQCWVLTKLISNYLRTPTILIHADLDKDEVIAQYSFTSFSKEKYLAS